MITSLQQRMIVLLIIPVALLLFLTGFGGFIYARRGMLEQWKEAAMLKLQRAAHHIDMRLNEPIMWIEMFQKTGSGHNLPGLQEWLIERLREIDGVKEVQLNWIDKEPLRRGGHPGHMQMRMGGMMPFHRGFIAAVTSPTYDAKIGEATVSLISNLEDEDAKPVAQLTVTIGFEHLMQDAKKLGWWQSDAVYLVDAQGRYLFDTAGFVKGHSRLGDTGDPFELAVLAEMKTKPSGTVFGSGHPPHEVAGFYRLQRAPWTVLLVAPGAEILAPIVKFRFYYAAVVTLCILVILLLIRLVVGNMVRSIREISRTAEHVAAGDYGEIIAVRTRDEIGQLGKSFNAMIQGLKERDFIRNTFGRYVDEEIAKELLTRPESAKLGGEKREVAILMSDIRDFTNIAESLTPEATISILNHYFSRLIEVTQKYRGIIVDFFGDGVLVFFDPFDNPIKFAVRHAVDCALEIQNTMTSFNEEMREEGMPELRTGIGINVGEVVVGNIGSESRAKYGIVGLAVNLTQRIQSTAKEGEVVVSEPVYRYVTEQIEIKRSFNASLKGLREPANLYAIDTAR